MLRFARRFTTRKWRWRLAIAATAFLIAGAVGVEVTSQPKFCNSCHIMNTYYSSWKEGSHRQVSCVECHIAPGATNLVQAKLNGLGQVVDDWLNRASTKPSASVDDFACLRSGCHVVGKLGEVEKPGRPYFFDHAKHLDLTYVGISVHCTTCHSHVKGSQHFEVNTNACVACHLMNDHKNGSGDADGTASVTAPLLAAGASAGTPAGHPEVVAPSSCDDCHKAPDHAITFQGLKIEHSEYLRFGATCNSCHRGTTAAPMKVDNAQCFDCHDFGMERFTDVTNMHFVHTEGKHKVECSSCHGEIRHGPDAQAMSLEQFDCQACHKNQHMVQRVAYQSGPSPTEPPSDHSAVSPMFLVHVNCTGCHVKASQVSVKPTSGATVAKAVPAACDKCHREGFGEQMVPMWQRSTHELYDGVTALLPAADKPWDRGNAQAAVLLTDARKLLDLVRVDGSWGVHNPKYTQRLIEQAREKVMQARTLCNADGAAR